MGMIRKKQNIITPEEEARFLDSDVKKMRSFCESLAEKVREIDPTVNVEQWHQEHNNRDAYYFKLNSHYLRQILGIFYPADGEDKPTNFAEIGIHLHSKYGYSLYQRFDFGIRRIEHRHSEVLDGGQREHIASAVDEEGAQGLIESFEIAAESRFASYPKGGCISFTEMGPDLNKVSFEKLVKVYYKLSEEYHNRFHKIG